MNKTIINLLDERSQAEAKLIRHVRRHGDADFIHLCALAERVRFTEKRLLVAEREARSAIKKLAKGAKR